MMTSMVPMQLLLAFAMLPGTAILVALLVGMALVIVYLLYIINGSSHKNKEAARKKAEDELQKRLKEILDYKYALDESSIVAITDKRGIIKYVNANFCKISKYSQEELIGQDHRIINSGYHPKEYIRQIWANITVGKIWRGELKNKAKDGTIYWVDTTIVPFLDDNGKPYQYVAIRADITQRKLAEEEILDYKYALDESSIVAITDQRGIIKYVNANFCKISKYSREELIGQDHRIINSGFHSKEYIRQIWINITNGKIWRGELKNRAKDGTIYWVDTTIVPFLNESGKPYQYVAIRADITQRKLAEEEIKILNEELEKRVKERTEELVLVNQELAKQNDEKEKRTAELLAANKELQSFNYISSHDLQEPLRKIQTFAKLVYEKEHAALSDTGKDYFSRMQDAARRMQQLIADLLAFSRVNTAERTFEKTNLGLIIDDVKNDLHEIIEERNAVIESDGQCEALIIPFQFRQLMQNLIGNALKFYHPDVSPHIVIKSVVAPGSQLKIDNHAASNQLSSDKNYCHITVSDNGIGFSPDYKERIFELFQRLHEKEEYSGTGIGLSIVKKIVENHNGFITANSELGQGARFDIYIPV